MALRLENFRQVKLQSQIYTYCAYGNVGIGTPIFLQLSSSAVEVEIRANALILSKRPVGDLVYDRREVV